MAEGGGLLNRYTGNTVSRVRIPSSPPLLSATALPTRIAHADRSELIGIGRPHPGNLWRLPPDLGRCSNATSADSLTPRRAPKWDRSVYRWLRRFRTRRVRAMNPAIFPSIVEACAAFQKLFTACVLFVPHPCGNPGFGLWVGVLLHCLPGSIGYSDPASKGGFPNVAPFGFRTWISDGRGD